MERCGLPVHDLSGDVALPGKGQWQQWNHTCDMVLAILLLYPCHLGSIKWKICSWRDRQDKILTIRFPCRGARGGWSAWGPATPPPYKCYGRTASPSSPGKCTQNDGFCDTSGRQIQKTKRKMKWVFKVVRSLRIRTRTESTARIH